jgi:hypothetical protein
MSDFLKLTVVALILVGGLVAVIGKFWHLTAEILRFIFELDVNPDKGIWILAAGLVMMLAGFALIFLSD